MAYLRKGKHCIWIDVLSLSGLAVAIYLVINELLERGYCPPYPVLQIPACYLVFVFFLIVFLTRFIHNTQLAKILFYIASYLGLATAVWFSANHLLEKLQCPVLFGIPLCFAALITFLAILLIGCNRFGKRRKAIRVIEHFQVL